MILPLRSSRALLGAAMLLGAFSLQACETGPSRPSLPMPDVSGPAPVPQAEEDEIVDLPSERKDEVVRVAILLPFTYQAGGSSRANIEDMADAMLKAAQMVAFESDNSRYVLIGKDTRGTAEGAQEMARQAIREGAEVILGPLFSESVEAVADVARPAGIPVIAFSSDSTVAGEGVYLLSFPPEAEIARVTDFAVNQGYARFGMMAPASEFGDRVAKAFADEVYTRGGDVVHAERYRQSAEAMIGPARRMAEYAAQEFIPTPVSPRGPQQGEMGQDDYRPQAPIDYDAPYSPAAEAAGQDQPQQRFSSPAMPGDADFGYQAVFLPEQGRLLRALAPLFPYYNVNVREVKLLGLSAWNNPLLTREPALNGGWFAAPDPTLAEGFKRRYEAAYGDQPPRLASLAYDAALLTARLSALPPEDRFSVQTIANPNGYLGADGLFRLRADGMVERGLAVLEIRPSGIVVLDPAPRSFVQSPTLNNLPGGTGF